MIELISNKLLTFAFLSSSKLGSDKCFEPSFKVVCFEGRSADKSKLLNQDELIFGHLNLIS